MNGLVNGSKENLMKRSRVAKEKKKRKEADQSSKFVQNYVLD